METERTIPIVDVPAGPLPIAFASERMVVIDKPSGMLSVPGRAEGLEDCVRARVEQMFPSATGPLTVHRLDLETSGLIVLALDADSHRELSRQFERRLVSKRYHALLQGDLPTDRGSIDLPIAKDWPNRPLQKICFETGKPSVTRYRVLTRFGDRTRVEFEPVTGRSHQLRIHAAHDLGLASPIVGDPLYGDVSSGPRLMLHATRIELIDPSSDRRITVESEAPF